MRRPQASFEAQPRNARLLAPRWASTPTAQNGKRGDFSPDPHVLSNTLCRGGRLCPPSKSGDFSRSFVGADAYIGPLKCCGFALDFHKTGQFRRADRVVRPYDVESKTNTVSPENRHKTGASCGSMRRPQASFEAQPRNARLLAPRWASTPTAQNGKRGDFSPDPHVLSNTLCRGGRLCPPFKIRRFSATICRGRCLHRPVKMLRIRIGFP